MYKVKIDGWKCMRCEHEWAPKSPGGKPKQCPSCHSPYWDRPVVRKTVSEARRKK